MAKRSCLESSQSKMLLWYNRTSGKETTCSTLVFLGVVSGGVTKVARGRDTVPYK